MENTFCSKHYEDLTKEELYKVLTVRQEIFVVEQDITYVDCDDLDQQALHCWVEDSKGVLLGYLRIIEPGVRYEEAAIGRVLTTRAGRGKGIGKELMKYGITAALKEYDSSAIRISAQVYLEKFYNDLGFETASDTYIEEGIDHIEMLYQQ